MQCWPAQLTVSSCCYVFLYAVGSQKVRSSLLFDHTLSVDQMLESMRDIQQSVRGMCEISQVDVRPQMPALFTKFVRQLRALDIRALQPLYSSATSTPCEKAKYVIFTYVCASLCQFLPRNAMLVRYMLSSCRVSVHPPGWQKSEFQGL